MRTPPRVLAFVAAATVVAAGLHGRDTPVPIVPGEALVRLSPLTPVLITVPLLLVATNDLREFERLPGARSLVPVRLAGAFVLVAAGAALAALSTVLFGHIDKMMDVAETSVTFVAGGLIGCSLLGADLGWVVPCAVAVATFFFGKNGSDEVLPWAWLLQPASSPLLLTVTGAAFATALTTVALFDTDGPWGRR